MASKAPQNHVNPFPTGDHILLSSQKIGFDLKSYLSILPPPLKSLAFALCEAQAKCLKLRDQYDRLSLTEQAKFRELSRSEALRARQLNKEAKIAKERVKLGKKERGWRKKHFLATGELFEETQARLMNKFKQYLEEVAK